MSDVSIAQVSPNGGAINAEHYQTYEMAKANDDVLGGSNIAQIRSYAAYARAQAQAIHKTIAATNGIDDVAAIKAEATETAQTFAKVGIYADQRIGEILRELPTRQGKRTDTTSVRMETEVTKSEAIKNAGIAHQQAIDLQAMAANPEIVEAVIAKATEEGRVVSRKQVLDAIKERNEARKEARQVSKSITDLESENASLRQQLEDRPEREVLPDGVKKQIRNLENMNKELSEDYEKLRQRYEGARAELRNIHGVGERQKLRSLDSAITELDAFRRKYADLPELVDVLTAINKTLEDRQ